MKEVFIFTDGSCLNNPGPGGYGVILKYKDNVKEIFKGFNNTTNNRMELMAVIAGLSSLKEPCKVVITTDSQYVKNGMSLWLENWKRNNWIGANKKPIKNIDLWQRLDEVAKVHQIHWQWVKGHSGHEENERCDYLARYAASLDDKQDDVF